MRERTVSVYPEHVELLANWASRHALTAPEGRSTASYLAFAAPYLTYPARQRLQRRIVHALEEGRVADVPAWRATQEALRYAGPPRQDPVVLGSACAVEGAYLYDAFRGLLAATPEADVSWGHGLQLLVVLLPIALDGARMQQVMDDIAHAEPLPAAWERCAARLSLRVQAQVTDIRRA